MVKVHKSSRLQLTLRGVKLTNVAKRWFGGVSSPVIEFRGQASGRSNTPDLKSQPPEWSTVATSAKVEQELDPLWPSLDISIEDLCYCDTEQLVQIAVFDQDGATGGSLEPMGSVETTVDALLKQKVQDPNKVDVSQLFTLYEDGQEVGKLAVMESRLVEFDHLGVSVHHLETAFLDLVRNTDGLSRRSNIHSIENLQGPPGLIRRTGADIVCPLDGKKGAAYVHCIEGEDNVGEATHMLSYSWSYKIGDIVEALNDFRQNNSLDPKRTYIWIDCLCINQHRVVEQKKNGGTGMLNFGISFPKTLKKIGHMLAMMAPWQAPVYLTRLWCIFEVYAAHTTKCRVDIIMPPREKDSLVQDVIFSSGDGITKLYQTFAKTKVQNAKASVDRDRKSILSSIESTIGYQGLNAQVNHLLRGWMKQVLMRLLATRENTNDGSYAKFCDRIGLILKEQGEQDTALDLYRKSLNIRQKALGKDHPKIATICSNIGVVLMKKGDYDGAMAHHERCLAIRLAKFGKDHADTATAYSNIGMVLWKKGDNDRASKQYNRCLAIRVAVLGADHPDTATTYNSIGLVMQAKGDFDGALNLYQKCLKIKRTSSGKEHPHTAGAYSNIGSVLKDKGDYVGALDHYKKCLSIEESVLGEDHPDTAITYDNIGGVLKAQGNFDGALEQYRNCLAIRETVLSNNHPDTAGTYSNIGMVLRSKGDYDGATKQLKKCLFIRESVLGKDHPDLATAFNNTGLVLKDKGNFWGALVQYRKCLAIREHALGKNHPSTASTYYNIGNVLSEMGDHDCALKQYQKCLAIHEIALGKDHPTTATVYSSTGALLKEKGDYDGALRQCMKCLAIRQSRLGMNHPDTAAAYNGVGAVLEAKGKNDRALDQYRKSLSIFVSAFGTNHPQTKLCLQTIQSLKRGRTCHLLKPRQQAKGRSSSPYRPISKGRSSTQSPPRGRAIGERILLKS